MDKNKQKFLGFWLGFLTAMQSCNPAFAALSESDKASQIFRNLLSNPGAENGLVGMTASGGSLSRATKELNPEKVGTGNAAFSWDSSSAGQTLTATPQTIPAGWYGKNGVLSCNIQTPSGTATHTLGLWDGSTLTQATTITSSATYARTTINFIMPSSGSLGYRFTSVASNEPAINNDDCVIGLAEGYNLSQVSQATLVASAYIPLTASCEWQASSTTFADYGTVAACPGPTVDFSDGVTVSTADSDLPQITLSNLPAGRYRVTATGSGTQGAAGVVMGYAISDGTTRDGDVQMRVAASNSDIPQFTVVGVFNYTSAQSSKTFKMQGAASSSNSRIFNGTGYVNGTKGLRFTVERFPSSAEMTYRPDLLNWRVESTISGASPDLNTGSSIGSYTGIESGSWTLANATGALSAYIPCSSTNDSSGTTCSAGNESAGIAFTPPTSGDIEVCASYSVDYDVGAAGAVGAAFAKYRIVQTGNTSQTVSASGSDEKAGGIQNISTNSRLINYIDHKVCGVFSVTGGTKQTFRLFYQDSVSGTVNGIVFLASNSSINGVLKMTARPLTQNVPAPVLVGSVTSNTAGQERVERAVISGDGSCTITKQSGAWISSTVHNSIGDCTLNISSGVFSDRPSCSIVVENTNVALNAAMTKISTTSAPSSTLIRYTTANTAGTLNDYTVSIICMGPK